MSDIIQFVQVSVDVVMSGTLRPVKSCESLASDTDTLPPLADRASAPLKHHTRYLFITYILYYLSFKNFFNLPSRFLVILL